MLALRPPSEHEVWKPAEAGVGPQQSSEAMGGKPWKGGHGREALEDQRRERELGDGLIQLEGPLGKDQELQGVCCKGYAARGLQSAAPSRCRAG